MYQIISKTADELEQLRENSSTEDTLTSLTQIETSLDKIKEIDTTILREEEEAATKFPSLLKLLTKNTRIFGNNAHIRECWYKVMTERPPPLAKREEKYWNEFRRAGRQKSGQQVYHKWSTNYCSETSSQLEPT